MAIELDTVGPFPSKLVPNTVMRTSDRIEQLDELTSRTRLHTPLMQCDAGIVVVLHIMWFGLE